MYFVDKHVRTKDILVENVLHERELIKKLHITVSLFCASSVEISFLSSQNASVGC